jgi:hypothetical protein
MASITDNKTRKQKVTFQSKIDFIPPEHTPTEDEKRHIWYNKEEYDRFKFNAASEAGVRLFDFFPPTQTKDPNVRSYKHKFVMIGNFDEQDDNKIPSIPTDATTDKDRKLTTMNASIAYHVPIKCANEYNDSINKKGEEICKRGLGYHFSHYRKRNRVWTRAMVLTWQKTMRSVKAEEGRVQNKIGCFEQHQYHQPLRLSQKSNFKLSDKSRRLLALVSSKCSRSSKQAALWRGKMDYEIAHPERLGVASSIEVIDSSNAKRADFDRDGLGSRKRQRCDNRNVRTGCTYVNGVLAVEI